MHKTLIAIILLVSKFAFSQVEISWTDLEDVEFSDLYVEEEDEYFLYPHFGPGVLALEGKEVILSGYILALDPDDGYYILSKGPFASCFFCGAGGPETVVELDLKSDKDSFIMDEYITMKGVLKLNADDIYHCNYIFQYAEVHKR